MKGKLENFCFYQFKEKSVNSSKLFQDAAFHSLFFPIKKQYTSEWHQLQNGVISWLAPIQFIKSKPFDVTVVSTSESPADDEEKQV